MSPVLKYTNNFKTGKKRPVRYSRTGLCEIRQRRIGTYFMSNILFDWTNPFDVRSV